MDTIFSIKLKSLGRRACVAVTLGFSLGALSACDNLLEVELESELTDDVLTDPRSASTQVNSAIGHFEDAYNLNVWQLFGREDGGEVLLCSGGTTFCGSFRYNPVHTQFDDMAVSLKFATRIHDLLADDWTVEQVPDRAVLMAISSIYAGAVLGWMGSTMCEVAVDAGPLMTPTQTYAMAQTWLDRALAEIGSAGGDFALPHGIASSAEEMVYGLRAQVRWMAGDNTGAVADAQRVSSGFQAFATREATPERRNIPYFAGTQVGYQELYGVIDWWVGQGFPMNPVTGQPWPSPLPFTGYRELAILPDGRAVRDDGLPIRALGPFRTPVEDTAVPDTRVEWIIKPLQGRTDIGYVNAKYDGEGADIPMVNWKEMVLIRAELAATAAEAITLVNELRIADNIPQVTYLDGTATADEIRYMIVEERRRALYLEGRYFYSKLQNPDLLWFPRGVGNGPAAGWNLEGGIRFLMPDTEFDLNPNLTQADRGTACAANERPVQF